MALIFIADTHTYKSFNEPEIEWISATRLVHSFARKFDAQKKAVECSKGQNKKYRGKKPEDIIAIWEAENKRAVDLGSWYHDQREKSILSCKSITREGVELSIKRPIMKEEIKYAPLQRLDNGIYPEHLVYLKSFGVCGQADRIEVVNGYVNVYDYKTNKEIKMKGFGRGKTTEKMLPPLSHLENCNYSEYCLQMSLYMFMVLKHNPNLKPGKIQLEHILFEIEEFDKNGYPIVALDALGDPMIKEVVPYEIPFLKKEVLAMLKYSQYNRAKILAS